MATITEQKLTYLQETKDAIMNALIEKGQEVSDTDTFRSYAEKIAAIVGGVSATITSGSVKTTSQDPLVIEHNLGVVPDIIYIYTSDTYTTDSYMAALGLSLSSAFAKLLGGFSNIFIASNGGIGTHDQSMATSSNNTILGWIYPTATTFEFGGKSNYKVKSGATYYWFAISGLT